MNPIAAAFTDSLINEETAAKQSSQPPPLQLLHAAADVPEPQRAAFPLESLPPALRDIVSECARVTKVPVAMPAVCCLAVVSASCGSRLRVRSIHGKTTPANIMALISAETGSGKSETYRECSAPFEACQERVRDEWSRTILPRARAEKRLLAREIKTLVEAKDKGDRNSLRALIAAKEAALALAISQEAEPCFIASDFTTPMLIKILCRMDGQLFTASPDAKNFVDMVLGRYNEGGTDEEVYLKAFSLETLDRHRVGDGSQQVQEACITGLWLTQPDKLERLLAARALSVGGLLPRLLIVQFNCPPLRVDLNEQGISDAARAEYGRLIADLFASFRDQERIHIIESDESAREKLASYHNAIADRRETELSDVTGFAARWGEYAWRLALVVHAARLGEDAHEPLSLADAEAGIALADWFAGEQLDVLKAGRMHARSEQYDKVIKLFSASAPEIVARNVYRANITPRDDTKLATLLLDEMAEKGLLAPEDRATGRMNHTQRVYRLASNAGKPSWT